MRGLVHIACALVAIVVIAAAASPALAFQRTTCAAGEYPLSKPDGSYLCVDKSLEEFIISLRSIRQQEQDAVAGRAMTSGSIIPDLNTRNEKVRDAIYNWTTRVDDQVQFYVREFDRHCREVFQVQGRRCDAVDILAKFREVPDVGTEELRWILANWLAPDEQALERRLTCETRAQQDQDREQARSAFLNAKPDASSSASMRVCADLHRFGYSRVARFNENTLIRSLGRSVLRLDFQVRDDSHTKEQADAIGQEQSSSSTDGGGARRGRRRDRRVSTYPEYGSCTGWVLPQAIQHNLHAQLKPLGAVGDLHQNAVVVATAAHCFHVGQSSTGLYKPKPLCPEAPQGAAATRAESRYDCVEVYGWSGYLREYNGLHTPGADVSMLGVMQRDDYALTGAASDADQGGEAVDRKPLQFKAAALFYPKISSSGAQRTGEFAQLTLGGDQAAWGSDPNTLPVDQHHDFAFLVLEPVLEGIRPALPPLRVAEPEYAADFLQITPREMQDVHRLPAHQIIKQKNAFDFLQDQWDAHEAIMLVGHPRRFALRFHYCAIVSSPQSRPPTGERGARDRFALINQPIQYDCLSEKGVSGAPLFRVRFLDARPTARAGAPPRSTSWGDLERMFSPTVEVIGLHRSDREGERDVKWATPAHVFMPYAYAVPEAFARLVASNNGGDEPDSGSENTAQRRVGSSMSAVPQVAPGALAFPPLLPDNASGVEGERR